MEKRKIRARDVIEDIRSGMNTKDLMNKYKFSPKALRLVFRRLLDSNFLSQAELDGTTSLYQNGDEKSIRKIPRKRIKFPLRIYDGGNPFKPGLVMDISERGLCISGIDSMIGDVKSFIIRTGGRSDGSDPVFEAKCRWVSRDHGKIIAGFEITNISRMYSKELDKIVSEN